MTVAATLFTLSAPPPTPPPVLDALLHGDDSSETCRDLTAFSFSVV